MSLSASVVIKHLCCTVPVRCFSIQVEKISVHDEDCLTSNISIALRIKRVLF